MRFITKLLPIALLAMTFFSSCEEVSEESKYDNWQERNEDFISEVAAATGESYVATLEQAVNIPVGKLFAIKDQSISTTEKTVYIYCKKLRSVADGRRPLSTEGVNCFYCGSLITGDVFDKNFDGYLSTDEGVLDGTKRLPSEFCSPTTFMVSSVISGWTAALQYMREGERWMVYIPWNAAYGENTTNGIMGYSSLTFDIILDKVID